MKLTEREKAYHDGYEQGRFDEYAERMGYDQAEKVKAKINKQKNCPYCQDPFMTFFGTDGELYQVSEDVFSTPVLIMIVDTKHKSHITKIKCCPMCGRRLIDNE